MGWSVGWDSKDDVVQHITRDQIRDEYSCKTIQCSLRGGVLWSVREYVNERTQWQPHLAIDCDLIENHGGDRGWGYKGLSEEMYPYHFSCPLSYFTLQPRVDNKEWRHEVRRFHRRSRYKFKTGDRLGLSERCVVSDVVVDSVLPRRVTVKCPRGQLYQLVRAEVVSVNDKPFGS